MKPWQAGALLVAALVVVHSFAATAADDYADDFDSVAPPSSQGSQSTEGYLDQPLGATKTAISFGLFQQKDFYMEIAAIAYLIAFVINFGFGRGANEALALAWAREFCSEGALLANNFSLLGPGYSDNRQEMLTKQSHAQFQLWASGRRYCSGMLATMHLRARQDLLQFGIDVINPSDDTLTLEVYMHARNMPPTVLAVGLPQCLKDLAALHYDVSNYATPVDVDRKLLHDWPKDRLHVVAESGTLFYALFGRQVMDLAFCSQIYETVTGRYFRWLHFSSEFVNDEGATTPVLRFSFKIPPPDEMAELARLMEVAMRFIDLIAGLEVPEKVKERAEKARQKARQSQQKGKKTTQEELLEKRKQERQDAEAARVKRMTPAARKKYEERKKRIEQGRQIKKRTVKI